VGIGLLGVSFAFGLTVLTMAFAIGHIRLSPQSRSLCRFVGWRPIPGKSIAPLHLRASDWRSSCGWRALSDCEW
jgi:hypothetical protein